MENIIKRAIEGGYEQPKENCSYCEYGLREYCIDPLFWRALGKACGWEEDTQYDLTAGEQFCYGEWYSKAMDFHEKNLLDGFDSAIKWLESIIN